MTVKRNDFERRQARSRLRELSKYYCAISSFTNFNDSLHTSNTERKPSLQDLSSNDQHSKPFTLSEPRLTSDETLTALAQLAAFKSQCERCCISLIDGNAQHIIAEATRSISLFNSDDYLPGDALALGIQTLPLEYGLSPLAIDAFAGSSELSYTLQGSGSTRDYIYVSDLSQEALTKDAKIFSHITTSLKFYLAVPLRSQSGTLIGVLSVTDPVVRLKTPRDVKILKEIAVLVVKHLDGIKIRADHRRTERLLDALSYFNQGGGSMDAHLDTVEQPHDYSLPPGSSQYASERPKSPQKEVSRPRLSTIRSSKVVPGIFSGRIHTRSNKVAISSTFQDQSSPALIVENVTDDSALLLEPVDGIERQSTSLTSTAVRRAFSRASNLIRESMDLDATCFLEIPQNERFKNSARRRVKSNQNTSARPGSSSAQQHDSSTTEVTSTSSESSHSNDEDDEKYTDGDVLCHRLGFSSRDKSSFASSTTTQGFLTVSVRLLTRLALKYPRGHIFHFDEAGSISSSDESLQVENNTPKTGVSRVKISGELCGHFPTARSLIFLPLYDNERQVQYAGFLGWTSDPVRALQNHEIVYVLGFANSLMCEVMRLETLATDKAKSDFISSISHELRSPLHGILAAGQLLSESKISSSQAEFVEMVDNCARTLLDIMNHLLEHAKINNFTKIQNTKFATKSPENRSLERQNASYSSITSVNLSSVVEETVESMVASSYRMLGRDDLTAGNRTPFSENSFSGRAKSASPLPTILFINFHRPLIFNSEAGSWRRIIMNLLGNSLKYTQGGHVVIRLNIQKLEGSKRMAELTVVDTGQGISGEFLKHRLYTPFAQEDNLSVGAGLGLSIVHQIVKSLNGKIRVDSEIGTGTEISVQIPLEEASQTSEEAVTSGGKDLLSLPDLRGKTVKFCGFGESSEVYSDPAEHARSRVKALSMMAKSVEFLLGDWFGITTVVSEHADIFVIEEGWLGDNLKVCNVSCTNVIVIGSRLQAERPNQIPRANVTYASCPVGPHRMARILQNLVIDWRVRDLVDNPNAGRVDSNGISTSGATEADALTPPDATHPLSSPSTDRLLDIKSISTQSRPSSSSSQRPNTPKCLPGEVKSMILLVDDNEINLRILANCVKKFQSPTMQFVEAHNGKEAIDKYIAAMNAGLRIPLIFMDISMPVMDGFTATRLIRNFEKSQGMDQTSQAVIVAFTGLASEQAQHDVEKYGFDLYYRKPVNVKTVRELVETTLVRNERPSSESAISP